MKIRSKQSLRRFQLKIMTYGNSCYVERIEQLEELLSRKPRAIQIDMVGAGEIPADSALLLRSVLMGRSPKTRLVTNARSSLRGGSVLVWLLGDRRIIRDDARPYFRRVDLSEDAEAEEHEPWKNHEPKYRDSFSEIDPEEGDYARVLQIINEFLPVKELAGRLIGAPVLRQSGLVENEQVDCFLAAAFGKSERTLVQCPPSPLKYNRPFQGIWVSRTAPGIILDQVRREQLESLTRASSASQTEALRARIILLAALNRTNEEIADELQTTEQTVCKWRRRFARHGLAGLRDNARSGRPARVSANALNTVLTKVLELPAPASRRFSTSAISEALAYLTGMTSETSSVAAATRCNVSAMIIISKAGRGSFIEPGCSQPAGLFRADESGPSMLVACGFSSLPDSTPTSTQSFSRVPCRPR